MLCVYNYIDLFAAQCPNIDYFDTNCSICKQKHSSVKSSIIIFFGRGPEIFCCHFGGGGVDPKKMEILKIFNHPPPPLINNEMSKSAIGIGGLCS